MKRTYVYIIAAVILVGGGLLYYFLTRPGLEDQIGRASCRERVFRTV